MSKRLAAPLRPADHQRTKRLVIAWHDGDELAADAVLTDAMADPIGVPGIVFGLTTMIVELAARLGVDGALTAGLRDDLFDDASDTDQPG